MPENAYVFDTEAEQSLLAACLLDANAARKIVSSIEPEDFYRASHAVIFKAMRSIVSKDKPLDYVVLAHTLDARGMLGNPISRLDLLNLCDMRMSLVAWPEYLRIVRECSAQRRILNAALFVAAESSRAQEDFDEYIAASKAKLRDAFPPELANEPVES